MIGVIVNTVAVIVGSLVGLVFKKGIPQKAASAVMIGIGLCSVYIGISGAFDGENVLILIVSIISGALIGTLLDIDGALTKLGELVSKKVGKNGKDVSVAEGFVTASLLFCVGAMTIVGSLDAGLTGDNELLFTKSLLDFFSAMMLSVSLGIGVMCAAAFVFVFQGSLVLLAGVIAPYFTEAAINEMTCAGSILIVAIGINLIGIAKIKVADYLPAIVIAPVIVWITELF